MYDIESENAYLIDMNVAVCTESALACEQDYVIAQNVLLPKKQCTWDAGFVHQSKSIIIFLHRIHPSMETPIKYHIKYVSLNLFQENRSFILVLYFYCNNGSVHDHQRNAHIHIKYGDAIRKNVIMVCFIFSDLSLTQFKADNKISGNLKSYDASRFLDEAFVSFYLLATPCDRSGNLYSSGTNGWTTG